MQQQTLNSRIQGVSGDSLTPQVKTQQLVQRLHGRPLQPVKSKAINTPLSGRSQMSNSNSPLKERTQQHRLMVTTKGHQLVITEPEDDVESPGSGRVSSDRDYSPTVGHLKATCNTVQKMFESQVSPGSLAGKPGSDRKIQRLTSHDENTRRSTEKLIPSARVNQTARSSVASSIVNVQPGTLKSIISLSSGAEHGLLRSQGTAHTASFEKHQVESMPRHSLKIPRLSKPSKISYDYSPTEKHQMSALREDEQSDQHSFDGSSQDICRHASNPKQVVQELPQAEPAQLQTIQELFEALQQSKLVTIGGQTFKISDQLLQDAGAKHDKNVQTESLAQRRANQRYQEPPEETGFTLPSLIQTQERRRSDLVTKERRKSYNENMIDEALHERQSAKTPKNGLASQAPQDGLSIATVTEMHFLNSQEGEMMTQNLREGLKQDGDRMQTMQSLSSHSFVHSSSILSGNQVTAKSYKTQQSQDKIIEGAEQEDSVERAFFEAMVAPQPEPKVSPFNYLGSHHSTDPYSARSKQTAGDSGGATQQAKKRVQEQMTPTFESKSFKVISDGETSRLKPHINVDSPEKSNETQPGAPYDQSPPEQAKSSEKVTIPMPSSPGQAMAGSDSAQTASSHQLALAGIPKVPQGIEIHPFLAALSSPAVSSQRRETDKKSEAMATTPDKSSSKQDSSTSHDYSCNASKNDSQQSSGTDKRVNFILSSDTNSSKDSQVKNQPTKSSQSQVPASCLRKKSSLKMKETQSMTLKESSNLVKNAPSTSPKLQEEEPAAQAQHDTLDIPLRKTKSEDCADLPMTTMVSQVSPPKRESTLQPIQEESSFRSSDDDTWTHSNLINPWSANFENFTGLVERHNMNVHITTFDNSPLLCEMPPAAQSIKLSQSSGSEASLSDFVVKQASSFGLDPQIFLRRDFNRLKSSPFKPRNFHKMALIESPREAEPKQHLISSISPTNEEQKNPLAPEKLMSAERFEYMQETLLRQSIQISVLEYYLKVKQAEDKKKDLALNKAISKVMTHEAMLREHSSQESFQDRHKLHFAFCFASPLVISGKRQHDQIEKQIYKLMPPLNFQKEFLKIKDSIEQAKVGLKLTKRQCTTNSLNEILAKRPLGIHFSGHGLLNNERELGPELYKMHAGEGNFLLLETEEGGGTLVSTHTLRQMIRKNYCERSLQLVVVATCHSETVGKVFHEAGAQHVICIHQEYEVEDDAVITFTDSFYGLLFDQKKICDAFEQARLQVALAHSDQQASIFKLLKHQSVDPHANSKRAKHQCCLFGPFMRGKLSIVDPVEVAIKNAAPIQSSLIGRAKDKFKLVQSVLANKSSRLVTLTGAPGVGKSSLLLSTLQWVEERSLLKGGSIYYNARDVTCSAVFTRKLCNSLMRENESLLQGICSHQDCTKAPMKALKLILTKLHRVEGDILLAVDNAEDLIEHDMINFRKLVSYFLQRVPTMKVLLTSRKKLYFAAEFKEECMPLSGLRDEHATSLFLRMTREIEQDEVNRLLDTKPDYERFPQVSQLLSCTRLHDHHLFKLLSGNPQSIILIAPVLSDPQRCIDLPQLYRMLTSNKERHLIKDVKIEDRMLSSLRLSAQVSIQYMIDTQSESLNLFFLLGFLPGGIAQEELEQLWQRVESRFKSGVDFSQLTLQSAQTETKPVVQCNLSRAYEELQRAQIIDATRKAETVGRVRMPEYVVNFSCGLIDDERYHVYHAIVAAWLESTSQQLFMAKSNKLVKDQGIGLSESDLECFDRNMSALIERQVSESQEQLAWLSEQGPPDEASKSFMTIALDHNECAFDDYSDGEESQERNPIMEALDKEMQAKAAGQTAQTQGSKAPKRATVTRNQSHARRKSVLTHQAEVEYDNWQELEEAELALKAHRDTQSRLERSEPVQKEEQRLETLEKQLSQTVDPQERARLNWQKAFKRVQEEVRQKTDKAMGDMKSIGGLNLQEESDSEGEYNSMEPFSLASQPQDNDNHSISEESKTETNFMQKFQRAMRVKYKDIFETINANKIKFQRGSLRQPSSKAVSDNRRPSVATVVQLTSDSPHCTLGIEERAILQHLVTKILGGDFRLVHQTVKKSVVKMFKSSPVFKGNVRRIQAFCLMQETFNTTVNSDSAKEEQKLAKSLEIEDLLYRAKRSFEQVKCAWGLGLTLLQEASFFAYQIKSIGLQIMALQTKKQKLTSKERRLQLQSSRQSSSQVSVQIEETRLVEERSQLQSAFYAALEQAVEELKKINHWKALAFAYRLVYENKMEVGGRHQELSSLALSARSCSDQEWRQSAREKRAKFVTLYRRSCDGTTPFNAAVCVQREQGEECSLMTEIVLTSENLTLFIDKVAQNHVPAPIKKSSSLIPTLQRGNTILGMMEKSGSVSPMMHLGAKSSHSLFASPFKPSQASGLPGAIEADRLTSEGNTSSLLGGNRQ